MTKKRLFLFWTVFIFIYFAGVNATPIFEDEAEYLLLAEQLVKTHNPLIYLQNGIFPMYGYLVAIINTIFHDSLVAGRVLNIFLASTLVFYIAKIGELYKMPSRFVWIANLLLIFSPILLLNSRIALLDTPVLVFTAWYVYFTAKLVKKPSIFSFWGLFISVLLASLTKPTALLGLPVIAAILFLDIKKTKLKLIHFKIVWMYTFAILPLTILYFLFTKQIQEITTSSILINSDFHSFLSQLKQNLHLTFIWFKVYYLQYLIVIPLLLFSFKSIRNKSLYFPMFAWVFSVLFGMTALNQFYFPRHILMISLPLVIISAGIISGLPKNVFTVTTLLIVLSELNLTWRIFTDLSNAPIALEDKFSYFENYTSGSKLKDISNTLKDLSKEKPITVWLDGSYVMEYGLRRELYNDQNINFKSFRLDYKFFQHGLEPALKDNNMTTYAIVNRWAPTNVNSLKLIKSFRVSFRHSQQLYIVP